MRRGRWLLHPSISALRRTIPELREPGDAPLRELAHRLACGRPLGKVRSWGGKERARGGNRAVGDRSRHDPAGTSGGGVRPFHLPTPLVERGLPRRTVCRICRLRRVQPHPCLPLQLPPSPLRARSDCSERASPPPIGSSHRRRPSARRPHRPHPRVPRGRCMMNRRFGTPQGATRTG